MPLQEISNAQASFQTANRKKSGKKSANPSSSQLVAENAWTTQLTCHSVSKCDGPTIQELFHHDSNRGGRNEKGPKPKESLDYHIPFFESVKEWNKWVSRDLSHGSTDSLLKTDGEMMQCLLCSKTIRGPRQNKDIVAKHVEGIHHQKSFQLIEKLKQLKRNDSARFDELLTTITKPSNLPAPNSTLKQLRAYYFNVTLQTIQSKKPVDLIVDHFRRRFLQDKLEASAFEKEQAVPINISREETSSTRFVATKNMDGSKDLFVTAMQSSNFNGPEVVNQTFEMTSFSSRQEEIMPRSEGCQMARDNGESSSLPPAEDTVKIQRLDGNGADKDLTYTPFPGPRKQLKNQTELATISRDDLENSSVVPVECPYGFTTDIKRDKDKNASQKPSEPPVCANDEEDSSAGEDIPLGYCVSPSSDISHQSEIAWMGKIEELDLDNMLCSKDELDEALQFLMYEDMEEVKQSLVSMPRMIVTNLDELDTTINLDSLMDIEVPPEHIPQRAMEMSNIAPTGTMKLIEIERAKECIAALAFACSIESRQKI